MRNATVAIKKLITPGKTKQQKDTNKKVRMTFAKTGKFFLSMV